MLSYPYRTLEALDTVIGDLKFNAPEEIELLEIMYNIRDALIETAKLGGFNVSAFGDRTSGHKRNATGKLRDDQRNRGGQQTAHKNERRNITHFED